MFKAVLTILFLFSLSCSLGAMESDKFEKSLKKFTTEKLVQNRDELYALFPTFDGSSIVPNFQNIRPASGHKVNAYIVDQISGALELYNLKQIETHLNRLIMIEDRHGAKVSKAYRYNRPQYDIPKSKKQIALESERAERLSPIKSLVVKFPMLIELTRSNRVATTKLYDGIVDLIASSGISVEFLFKAKSENPYEVARFLFLLLDENKQLRKDLVSLIGQSVVDSIKTINESIDEIDENGAALLIHNDMLVAHFWSDAAANFDDEISKFSEAVSLLRAKYPLQKNNMTRLVLGTGLMVAGTFTSFTGVSLGAVATGAMILAGSTLAVLDGIDTHRLFESNQVNNGLFLSKLISTRDHLENKKMLVENMVFAGIDIIAAPMDALSMIRILKVKKVSRSALKGLGPNRVAIPFLESKGVDFKVVEKMIDGKETHVFKLLPSESSALNKYIKKASQLNPEVEFVYAPGHLGDYTRGMYNDNNKLIFVGDRSLRNAHLPTYFDPTVPHELMHSVFYLNFRKNNFDYGITFHSPAGAIPVSGYKKFMSIQESRTFAKSAKNSLKKIMIDIDRGEDIKIAQREFESRSRRGMVISDFSRNAINSIIKDIDDGYGTSFLMRTKKETESGSVIQAIVPFGDNSARIDFSSSIESLDQLLSEAGKKRAIKELRKHLRTQKSFIISDFHYQSKMNAIAKALAGNKNGLANQYVYKAFLTGLSPNSTRFSGQLPAALLARGVNANSFKEVAITTREYMGIIATGSKTEKVLNGRRVLEFSANVKGREAVVTLDLSGNFIDFK